MTADLHAFFNPRSIAIVGASADPAAISGRPLRILRQHGYDGAIYPVNPRHRELRGLACYPSIGDVPERVDLALVTVPARLVPEVLAQCAAAEARFALVFSSGFAEAGGDGLALQEEMRKAIAGTALRVCGPNSEGFFNVTAGVPAGFSPTIDPDRAWRGATAGPIGIVAQSGGLGFALFNRGLEQGLGFSAIVSTGNEVDLEALDYVDHLLDDPATRVILAFVESLKQARRLPEVARKAAELGKPLIVAKIGRSEPGRRAAASHTGSLVGSDEVYEAAFRQLGVLRVDDVEEMLDLAAYFSAGRLPRGRRVAILTVSGGAGAWLADACATQGLELPEVSEEVQAEISPLLPSYGSAANPVDGTAQAITHGGVEQTLDLLVRSRQFDSIATILSLAATEVFEKVLPSLRLALADPDLALVHYSYTTPTAETVATLRELGIPCYTSPLRTARALARACWYREFLEQAAEIALFQPNRPASDPLPRPAGRLAEHEAYAYLAPCGIPIAPHGLARSAAEAVALFEQLGSPVALKVQSPDLPHKSDLGGVRLSLATAEAVRRAYDEIMAAARAARPEANIHGILVQGMAPDGIEVILGARLDPDFGPLVLVGLGGIQVEVLRDVALRLAPLSRAEARAMLGELRAAPLLRGVRGRPPADVEALTEAIVRFSELAARLPSGLATVEINPLLVLPQGEGVIMVDAAVELEEVGT